MIFIFSSPKGISMEIKVEIQNIDVTRGGNLMVFAFTKDGFPIKHEKAIAKTTIRSKSKTDHVILNIDIKQGGELAFKVLHDEDMNGRTTKNWTGIWPNEGLAFSNNQKMGVFAPPSFKKSKLAYESYINGVLMTITYP